MGLDIDYFYSLTPRQFENIQIGYHARRDAEMKMQILLTRKMMFATLLPHTKNLTEEQLLPLEEDKDWLLQANKKTDAQQAKDLEESIKYWERIDALREEKATC